MGKKGNKKKATTKSNQQNATSQEDVETITEMAVDNLDKSESNEGICFLKTCSVLKFR